MKPNHSELLNAAITAALQAGQILRRGFGTSFAVSSKSGKHNLVTEYDTASEKTILSFISEKFPGHQFLAEESGASKKGDSGVAWIIDPLDGTVNFAHGIPVFSVSIAAAVGETVVCGAVYQPITEELFFAQAGKGSYLNGSRLQVQGTEDFDAGFYATGFPYNTKEDPLHCIETFTNLARMGVPIRRLGSAAIDLSYVAAGRFDGFWEVVLQPWDFAAGMLIVQEAGGKVTDYEGRPLKPFTASPVVATNGRLHQRLLQEVRK